MSREVALIRETYLCGYPAGGPSGSEQPFGLRDADVGLVFMRRKPHLGAKHTEQMEWADSREDTQFGERYICLEMCIQIVAYAADIALLPSGRRRWGGADDGIVRQKVSHRVNETGLLFEEGGVLLQ